MKKSKEEIQEYQKLIQFRLNLNRIDGATGEKKENEVWIALQNLKKQAESKKAKSDDKSILCALITDNPDWISKSVSKAPSQKVLYLKLDNLEQSIEQKIREAQVNILSELRAELGKIDFSQVGHNGNSMMDVLDDTLKTLAENFETHVAQIEFVDED